MSNFLAASHGVVGSIASHQLMIVVCGSVAGLVAMWSAGRKS
ncbi:MAG TPA: hypothetical protein VJS38_03270 [Phenylobacterium sp.]|nr:hypothetical protein [Phenylobacterium sp.]HKR87172.1 hypothetical protein [Phenylobacterium sp.]